MLVVGDICCFRGEGEGEGRARTGDVLEVEGEVGVSPISRLRPCAFPILAPLPSPPQPHLSLLISSYACGSRESGLG